MIIAAYVGCSPEERHAVHWYHRPALPATTAGVVGLLGVWASELLTHDAALRLIIGLVTGIAALQIGELWQLHTRTPLLARMEQALADRTVFEQVDSLLDANAALAALEEQHPVLRSLLRERRGRCLAHSRATLEELAQGRIRVDDPDYQYAFAVDLVARAESKVLAVSYRDEEFWTLEAGNRYIEHNSNLLARQGNVERIFVFEDQQTLEAQRSVIQMHVDKGFDIWVMPLGNLKETDKEDFVVYDNEFVRYAEPVEFSGSKKKAVLDVNESVVLTYLDKYNNIKLRAKPATQMLA